MTQRNFAAALLMSTALPGLLSAAPVPAPIIDTDTQLSTMDLRGGYIHTWGGSATHAYGQTFTFDKDVSLRSVAFEIDSDATEIDYDLRVFAWDAASRYALGEALAAGSGTTSSLDEPAIVLTEVGPVTLGAGQYIIFLHARSPGRANWTATAGDVYEGGEFFYQHYGDDEEAWTTRTWTWYTHADLAFDLLFGPAVKPLDELAAASVGASQIIVADGRSLISSRASDSFAARANSLPYTLGTKTAPGGDDWLKGNVYTWVDFNGFYADDDSADRSFRGAGVQVGADMELSPGLIAGLSLGADTIATATGTFSHEGDMIYLQPYLAYRSGAWAGEASVILGKGSFDQSNAGTTGEGESRLRALTLRGSYDIAYAGATITPSLGLTYGTQTVEGTGGALAGTGEQSVDFSQFSLGARYARPFGDGAYFVGVYADHSDTDAPTETVSELLVDEGWTGRVEVGGSFATRGGYGIDTSVQLGGLGGDLKQVSGGLKVSFRF
ncbi:autotransporter outer membrane beta-barrel domain-containing protein [Oceanicola sp. 502str15]|uniref:autotransporter outer membrane beta-barrel domain-containing protein n=1 Tax=Oceanicola sp. 502str15 TaxID=2696061 RepID=UPI0020947662|nr:autotransporter outer membrane beta-barrel domain-containing protein [Oceanicola sp. 502str15]MCO6382867.1 hypothetical protein [Oceanicola sp. 502str15]